MVEIFWQLEKKLVAEKTLEEIVKMAALKTLGIDTTKTISIFIVEEKEMKRLNFFYRHVDSKTDVLSFREASEESLGAVFICFQVATTQSEAYNQTIEKEMAFLTIHGILHLLGFDHESESEEKIMFKKQQEIMQQINV